VAAGGLLFRRRLLHPPVPEEARLLMGQGVLALEQSSPEAHDDGIAAFRRVVEIAPDYADGWGMLAYAYGFACHSRESDEANSMRGRAQAAARRAFELEPGNVDGELALAVARPFVGQWLERERGFRHVLEREPGNKNALRLLAVNLIFVGRASDALPLYDRIGRPLAPSVYGNYIEALWNAGRLEEADRAVAEARSLYPSDPVISARRYHMLLFGGRAGAAIAMLHDSEDEGAVRAVKVARAMESRDPADVKPVIEEQMRLARLGSGYAREAIVVANALGREDEAFALAEAYYFSRGFVVPDRQAPSAASYSPLNERHTRMLFDPASRMMRADPRFRPLVDELGLERYWRDSGSQPDYRRA
jgi:tetratricopeptide (TPR) repeat protein